MTSQMTLTNSEPLASVESHGELFVSPSNFETFEKRTQSLRVFSIWYVYVKSALNPII